MNGRVLVVYFIGLSVGAFLGTVWTRAYVQAQSLFDKPPVRLSSKDAIIACLQREGVLVAAVTDKWPPRSGHPVTADMFTVVCVEEKR